MWVVNDVPVYTQAGCDRGDFPYLELILAFTSLCWVFETYLDIRQRRRLKVESPPEQLVRVVKEIDEKRRPDSSNSSSEEQSLLKRVQAKFAASRSYNLDKSSFGLVESAIHQIEGISLLMLGFITRLASRLWGDSGWAKNEIIISLLFLGLNMVYENVFNLPFDLYRTFVVEQRHGFNKQTLKLFFTDKIKGILLTIVLGAPLVSGIIAIIKAGGKMFYLYLWLFVFAVSLLLMTIYPSFIAPLFNKFEPLEDPALKARIEALASKVNFPLKKIFVVDGSTRSAHSNAYMYGMGSNKRIVLFDTLLKEVEAVELEAILGHELGHWKMWHTIQMFVVSQVHLFVAFWLFGSLIDSSSIYRSFGFAERPTIIGLFLFFTVVWAPVDKVLSFAITYWTRHNEFEADAFGVALGYGRELQTGLVRLHLSNLSAMAVDEIYSAYHYSHPPLVERLAAITRQMKKRA